MSMRGVFAFTAFFAVVIILLLILTSCIKIVLKVLRGGSLGSKSTLAIRN